MSGIVIYSSFFPNEEQLFRGIDFLKTMKSHFYDYRIYIGIQVDSIQKWKEIISDYKENGLDITYGDVNPDLYVNSDVSGYQKALELLHKDNRPIIGDFIWFGHSKGVTTGRMEHHNFLLENFWGKKNKIENDLNQDKKAGCFGNTISFLPAYDIKKSSDDIFKISKIEKNKDVLRYMFTNTFFVIKNEIFIDFFKNIKINFFNKLITGHYGIGDRYFFERDFIHFVDILGYYPIYNEVVSNISWVVSDENKIKNEIELWKKI